MVLILSCIVMQKKKKFNIIFYNSLIRFFLNSIQKHHKNLLLLSCMLTDSPSPESDAVSPLRDLSGTDDPPLSKIHSTEDLFTIIHR